MQRGIGSFTKRKKNRASTLAVSSSRLQPVRRTGHDPVSSTTDPGPCTLIAMQYLPYCTLSLAIFVSITSFPQTNSLSVVPLRPTPGRDVYDNEMMSRQVPKVAI